jgi:transposase-like protein
MAKFKPELPIPKRQVTKLERLRNQFARFRRSRRSGAPIPKALRDAVLALLDEGVPATEVRRAFGVTRSQVEQWAASADRGSPNDVELAAPQVLSVVEPAGEPMSSENVELDLRIGLLRLSLRLEAQG